MTSPKVNLRLVLLIAVVVSVSITADAARASGGWKPIKNLNEPHVKEIAEFAVSEYNKASKADLKLESIVSGETQVVSGMNYRLVVTVSGKSAGKYQAIVWEKPWEKFMKLTSFEPVKA